MHQADRLYPAAVTEIAASMQSLPTKVVPHVSDSLAKTRYLNRPILGRRPYGWVDLIKQCLGLRQIADLATVHGES